MAVKEMELLERILKRLTPADYAAEYESAMQAAATAALVVRPSTVAAITIWNGANEGGRSLIIDRIFTFNLVSTAAENYFSLWYCMHLDMAKPTAEVITLRGTGDGREPDMSVVVDAGATVLDDGWFPAGGSGRVEAVGILPGSMVEWEARERLVVPPRHGMSLQVVSGVVGNTFQSGASWYRRQR